MVFSPSGAALRDSQLIIVSFSGGRFTNTKSVAPSSRFTSSFVEYEKNMLKESWECSISEKPKRTEEDMFILDFQGPCK